MVAQPATRLEKQEMHRAVKNNLLEKTAAVKSLRINSLGGNYAATAFSI